MYMCFHPLFLKIRTATLFPKRSFFSCHGLTVGGLFLPPCFTSSNAISYIASVCWCCTAAHSCSMSLLLMHFNFCVHQINPLTKSTKLNLTSGLCIDQQQKIILTLIYLQAFSVEITADVFQIDPFVKLQLMLKSSLWMSTSFFLNSTALTHPSHIQHLKQNWE